MILGIPIAAPTDDLWPSPAIAKAPWLLPGVDWAGLYERQRQASTERALAWQSEIGGDPT